jgi:hypothetical protein
MSTASYLQRFLFRWKYAILIILIISATSGAVSFEINRWLPNYALSFSHLIAQQFQTKISFKTVNYRFPNYIIFKDVNVIGSDEKAPILQASEVIMNFSFPLLTSATPLNYVIMDGMAINFPVLKNYLIRHHKKIFAWAKTLPKGNMRLLVPDGQCYLKDYLHGNPAAFKIDLSLNQGRVSAHGYWFDSDRYNYELFGNVRNAGFDLDKLTLIQGRSSMNLWGSWRDNNIDWKGFIFYDKFYILDIDGHLKIHDKDIVLDQLSFSIDGNGVGARGHCTKQDLYQCDADMTYWQGTQHLGEQGPVKNVNLHLHAQNTPRGLVLNGTADLSFLFDPNAPASIQNAHIDFKDLKARIINGNSLKLKIGDSSLILILKNKTLSPIKVPLQNLLASIDYAVPYQKTVNLSARMLAGHCYSRIFLDTSSFPWQIKSQGRFDGVVINHGILSGAFNLQTSETIQLSGNLALHNGNFNDTPFQAWAAKTLQMPSLENVSGADLSFQFKIDGKSRMLKDLRLNTDNFDLSGNFYLDEDDLVSSQGSVRFSEKLLNESDIGRHIIGLVRGAWTLPFEFRLSGNVHRMNFEWDNSPLKDKVRQHMFSFFERIIDRRMDAHPYYNVTIPNESVSPG